MAFASVTLAGWFSVGYGFKNLAARFGDSPQEYFSMPFRTHKFHSEGVHFLADFHPKGAVAQAYDCYLDQAGSAGRCTYVIDGAGTIIDVDQVVPLETPDADRLLASLAACKV